MEKRCIDPKSYNYRWNIILFLLNLWISNIFGADVTFLVLTEKDNVQNPFLTAFEKGMSDVQAKSSPLTFDQTPVVLDR